MAEKSPIDHEKARNDMLTEIRHMQSNIVERFNLSDTNDILNLSSSYQNLVEAGLYIMSNTQKDAD